jgi:ElaB/YqjD/DUF883 family membrane-anchored ribosome-binding protein
METHFPAMDNVQSRLARERVLADLKTLTSDAEELLKATAADLSDKAKEARARVAAALPTTRFGRTRMKRSALPSVSASCSERC